MMFPVTPSKHYVTSTPGFGVVHPIPSMPVGLPGAAFAVPGMYGVALGTTGPDARVKKLLDDNKLTLSVTDTSGLHARINKFNESLQTIVSHTLAWPIEVLISSVPTSGGDTTWGGKAHEMAYNTAINAQVGTAPGPAKDAYKALFAEMTKLCGEMKTGDADKKENCRNLLLTLIENKPNIDKINTSRFVSESFAHHLVPLRMGVAVPAVAPFSPFRLGEATGRASLVSAEPMFDAQIGGFRVNSMQSQPLTNFTASASRGASEPVYDPQIGGFRAGLSNQVGGADEPSTNGKMVDLLGFLLDIASLFPGTNLPFIIASMFLNIGEGRNDDAFITLMGMLPIIGTMVSVPTKYFNRVVKEEMGKRVERIEPISSVAEPTPIAAEVANPPSTAYRMNRFN